VLLERRLRPLFGTTLKCVLSANGGKQTMRQILLLEFAKEIEDWYLAV
jgi:hypothetical protein